MKRSALALGGIFAFVGAVTIAHGHSVNRLAVGTASRTPIAVRTQIITAEECLAQASDGKVAICHATGNHYTLLEVAVEACVGGHGGHEADFVAPITGCP